MDEVDKAEQVEQEQRDDALAKVRRATAPEYHPDFNGEDCVDCEERLPPARVAWGRVRCVECQQLKEARHGA